MKVAAVVERVQRVAAVRADASGGLDAATAALADVRRVRSYLAACEADLVRRVKAASSFPEKSIADTSGGSLGGAGKTIDRSDTLDATPSLAAALDDAAITAAHVDTVTRAGKGLESDQRAELFERVDALADVAAVSTVEQFGRRVRDEVRRLLADDGVARLERQRRATTLSTWVDGEGMWNLRAKFDPVTGVKLASRLEHVREARFAEATPDTCPSDPVTKQQHLAALALAKLITGTAGTGRSGRPEFVPVIDVSAGPCNRCSGVSAGAGDAPGRLDVSWPIPIEIPARVVADLIASGEADVAPIVVRNGVVLHAPGELNLGRTTRLANRAQRRALRGLYRTCAIPGCTVGYDRCKLHHIIWWRHGGRTDLDNLLPVCTHHHTKIHDHGWNIELGPNRELTLALPDGTIHNTSPPTRRAA